MKVLIIKDGMVETVELSSLRKNRAYYHTMQDLINDNICFVD